MGFDKTKYNGNKEDVGQTDLDDYAPEEMIEWYLDSRRSELSEKTMYGYRNKLEHFLDWLQENDIDSMEEIDVLTVDRYKSDRLEEVKKVSVSGEIDAIRTWLKYCAKINAVPPNLHERLITVSLEDEEEVSDRKIDSEEAEKLFDYLHKYEYASAEHVIFLLFWKTGMRIGSLRALDVDDVDTEERMVALRHRPETDTPLKNKKAGERKIALSEKSMRVLKNWIEDRRPDVTDEHGREPLIATKHGRRDGNSIRRRIYRITQPCYYAECPLKRDPQECEYTSYAKYSQCDMSESPHAVRRGSITYQRKQGIPVNVVSDRTNASVEVLEKHYDARTEEERAEEQRKYLDDI